MLIAEAPRAYFGSACDEEHLSAHFYAKLCDAGDGLVRHEVADAYGAALFLLQVEGELLRLVLDDVDTLPQGIAFGVGQGAADGVAPIDWWRLEALLYGKHDVLQADGGCQAKSYGECPADVLLGLRQGEAYGVAPLPTFLGHRLVTVEKRTTRARSKQTANQRKKK